MRAPAASCARISSADRPDRIARWVIPQCAITLGPMNRRAWTLLLVLGAIWGASYLLIKIGLRDLSPGMIAFVRVALAAVVLLALAASRGALGGFRSQTGWVFAIALAQVSA